MIEALFAPGSAPFTVALLVMFGLLLVEIGVLLFGGAGADAVDEFVVAKFGVPDFDASTGMEATAGGEGASALGRLLAWLYVGKVPLLMLLIVFLALFGLGGLLLQALLLKTIGFALPSMLAAPLVFVATLPLLRGSAAGLARVMPRDETSAVDASGFVGLTATVVGGTARPGLPAQARLLDWHGTTHYVLVEPDEAGSELPTGAVVLLVRELGHGRYAAIPADNPALHDLH